MSGWLAGSLLGPYNFLWVILSGNLCIDLQQAIGCVNHQLACLTLYIHLDAKVMQDKTEPGVGGLHWKQILDRSIGHQCNKLRQHESTCYYKTTSSCISYSPVTLCSIYIFFLFKMPTGKYIFGSWKKNKVFVVLYRITYIYFSVQS